MAGYSGKTLAQKLGLKPHMRVVFLRMPGSVGESLQPLPADLVVLKALAKEMDYVHYFADQTADLEGMMAKLKEALAKDGSLWISWRKGRKGTDLTENAVRLLALAAGLVDVKVCAVDETWSGLKLVYRVKDR